MSNSFLGKWQDVLSPTECQMAAELANKVQTMRSAGKIIYPSQDNLFSALLLTPPNEVKVVILGQDPYHEPGQAQGLAFSVPSGIPKPPSLQNIFKELKSDLGLPELEDGDLTYWAEQGVLLLNTVLSVEEGVANSHKDLGWQKFTHAVLKACCELPQPVVFVLWGTQAKTTCVDLLIEQHPNKAAIYSPHPSPLSASRGFFGSRPFSKVNNLLREFGVEEIQW